MAIASFSLPFTYLQKPSSCRCRCSSSSSSSFEKPIFAHSSNGIVNKALQEIRNSGVIACLRAQNADLANRAARAALDGGISALEIVVSTPDVFEVLRDLVHDYPAKTFGVGTVLQAKDAKDSIKAGAKFLMSPATVMDILVGVSESDVLYIPGVMTPTEILSAFSAGAKIVKVYPVSALGGVGYISALKRPFSHIPMVASQGITIDLIGQYIGQGASAVVLSDAIFDKEAMSQQNFDKIYQLASHSALQGVHEKREIRLSHPSSCFKFGKINCAGSSKGELHTLSEPQSESRLVGAVDFGYQMVSPKTKAVLVSSYVTDLQSVATCCVYVAKGADMPDYKQLQQQLASVRKKIATLNLFAESEKKKIVNEILVLTEPLLTDEDYNVRIIGREIVSDLSKAAGIDAMIHVTRLNIDSPNEHIRNAAARSLSIVASALGIPALLPFLEEICFQMESWEARHTGVMIVYHITVLIGSANLLPYLSYLMEIIEPRLKDDIEKIRNVTNVAMDGLAVAATLWY